MAPAALVQFSFQVSLSCSTIYCVLPCSMTLRSTKDVVLEGYTDFRTALWLTATCTLQGDARAVVQEVTHCASHLETSPSLSLVSAVTAAVE